jgi:AraC family transcriptional regulator of adaptative response/methylated-DNA-[protein]-cysteine methyltransferase
MNATARATRPGSAQHEETAFPIRFAVAKCSLGLVLVARRERGICAILMGDSADALERDLKHRFPGAQLSAGDAATTRLLKQVVALVDVPARPFELPLDPAGTEFQRRVWRALREIPAGATASYADIARRIGAPKSVRAVAQACGANPLALAIPCHRVVRSDGGLSGYRWGVERKRALLAREARA